MARRLGVGTDDGISGDPGALEFGEVERGDEVDDDEDGRRTAGGAVEDEGERTSIFAAPSVLRR